MHRARCIKPHQHIKLHGNRTSTDEARGTCNVLGREAKMCHEMRGAWYDVPYSAKKAQQPIECASGCSNKLKDENNEPECGVS